MSETEQTLIWIDSNIRTLQFDELINQIKAVGNYKLFPYDKVEEGFNELLSINFNPTKVILSGEYFEEFFKMIKNNLKKLKVIPEVFIFSDKKNIDKIRNETNILPFFQRHLIFEQTNEFNEIKKFLEIDSLLDYFSRNEKFIFEYCERIESLYLPINYHQLMSKPSNEEIYKFNIFLHINFGNSNDNDFRKLLNQTFKDSIPIEVIVKYWLRLFSKIEFSEIVNENLRNQVGNNFDVYVRLLYYALDQQYLQSSIDFSLYKGGKISNQEFDQINEFLKYKSPNLPGAYCFSKIFLSFSLNRDCAFQLMKKNKDNKKNNEKLVLFQISSGNNIDSKCATNVDICEYSFFPEREEVLFFPYSCFEVVDIKDTIKFEFNYCLIRLRYLGRYYSSVPKNLSDCTNIPATKFSQEIFKSKITDEEKKKIIIKNNPELQNQENKQITYNYQNKPIDQIETSKDSSQEVKKEIINREKKVTVTYDEEGRKITTTNIKTTYKYTTKNEG